MGFLVSEDNGDLVRDFGVICFQSDNPVPNNAVGIGNWDLGLGQQYINRN
jgi:hypothetical protein